MDDLKYVIDSLREELREKRLSSPCATPFPLSQYINIAFNLEVILPIREELREKENEKSR